MNLQGEIFLSCSAHVYCTFQQADDAWWCQSRHTWSMPWPPSSHTCDRCPASYWCWSWCPLPPYSWSLGLALLLLAVPNTAIGLVLAGFSFTIFPVLLQFPLPPSPPVWYPSQCPLHCPCYVSSLQVSSLFTIHSLALPLHSPSPLSASCSITLAVHCPFLGPHCPLYAPLPSFCSHSLSILLYFPSPLTFPSLHSPCSFSSIPLAPPSILSH